MTRGKRILDLAVLVLLSALLWPVLLAIAAAVLCFNGRPVIYKSERMQSVDTAFHLWKFRTMRPDPADSGVTGGDKSDRVTPLGRILRKMRADELPQLWNVARGDISFVGPRPPLRRYVEAFPELYADVLRSRPGITGLATLRFHAHEERILGRCRSAAETDRAYRVRCVPRKAQLDLIYARNRSVCFDLALIWQTAVRGRPRRTLKRKKGPPVRQAF